MILHSKTMIKKDLPLFIFPYSEEMNSSQRILLLESTELLLSAWQSHGNSLSASVKIYENRFLIIQMLEGNASGCSKDKLFQGLEEINQKLGLRLEGFERFFVWWQEKILTITRKELKDNILNPDFIRDARFFPTWISSTSEFDSLWKMPLSSFPFLLPSSNLV